MVQKGVVAAVDLPDGWRLEIRREGPGMIAVVMAVIMLDHPGIDELPLVAVEPDGAVHRLFVESQEYQAKEKLTRLASEYREWGHERWAATYLRRRP